MVYGSKKDGYEAAMIDVDQANIVAFYNQGIHLRNVSLWIF